MIRQIALVATICAFPVLAADDALPKGETILDHYIEVTGGKAAYEKRTSEISTGTIEFAAQGLKGSLTRYAAPPDKSYASMELDGVGKIESGSVDGIAWEKSAMMGPRVKSGDEKAQSLREAAFNGVLNWRKQFSKVETVGVETVEGQECYKLAITPNEGKPETAYYSKKTGLEVKSSTVAASPMGEIPVEVVVSEYKEFGGILQPAKITQKVAGQELVITIQSVKINEPIPASRFDPPADVKALMTKPAQ
jgi:hypothetical protein